MGYCIQMKSANFLIRKEKAEAALAAVKALGNGENDKRANGGGGGTKWFAWMNNAKPDEWNDLEAAMKAWWYPIKRNEDGDYSDISFRGEKIGQEDVLFEILASFVESGSVISMFGEDGATWDWTFNEGEFKEVQT